MTLPALLTYEPPVDKAAVNRELKHQRQFPAFDEDDGERIVSAIAEGTPLGKLCTMPGYPKRRVVDIWLATVPDFAAEVRAAEENQADTLAIRAVDVSADQKRDPACRRVEAEACKWLAGKLSRKYAAKAGEGASLTVNQTNINVDGDMHITPDDAYRRLLEG